MLLGVFCLFDSVAGSYGTPFFTHNRGSAIRGIRAQVEQDKTSMLSRYPADFQLYDLGTYEEDSGLFHSTTPVFIINVKELVTEADDVQQPQR